MHIRNVELITFNFTQYLKLHSLAYNASESYEREVKSSLYIKNHLYAFRLMDSIYKRLQWWDSHVHSRLQLSPRTSSTIHRPTRFSLSQFAA